MTNSHTDSVILAGNIPVDANDVKELVRDRSGAPVNVVSADSIDSLIELLLSMDRCVIVVDWSFASVPDTIEDLKNDEAVSMIPVLAITDDQSGAAATEAYAKGAEICLRNTETKEYICQNIVSLLRTHEQFRDMLTTLSDLKADAVSSFLLADLIRRYVPATVWNLAQQHAEEQKLVIPHQEMILTVVFADIKEFTRITQHLSPQDVILKLNAIYEIVSEHVYANGGDIDKFVGDAFFAVFEDPGAAVRSMVALQDSVEELNRPIVQSGEEPFLFRIGIHTGPVIRGNVGGGTRYDNTLIGDTVNAASRLEAIAPPGGIIASEQTLENAPIDVTEDRKMSVELRGRDQTFTAAQIYPA